MTADELCGAPAVKLAALLRTRDISPVELTEAFLDRIERRNPALNAYVTLLADEALARAREIERTAGQSTVGPLHGVPVAIKDLFDFKAGVRNTFGSRPLAGFVPNVTATYVERLEAAGAIVLGKTNTPEFGCKATTDNLLFGPTSTPFAVGRNAGGSSGGGAAAVADGLAALAQGSDAGGSLRIPAAWCGIVGLKTTWGRVANVTRPDGFVAVSPFIHSGAMARTVADVALMTSVMAGFHPRDPYATAHELDWVPRAERGLRELRIAYSPDLGAFPVQASVAAVVAAAVADLAAHHARVSEITMRLGDQLELCACWNRQHAVRNATTAATFARRGIDLLAEHREELTSEFTSSVELGQHQSAVDAQLDSVTRTQVLDALEDVLTDHDILICPTVGIPPVPNAADGRTTGPSDVDGVPVDPAIGWALTYPVNFTGHPSASVPAGLDATGLPVGLQVIGRRFRDDDVLAVAAALEQIRPWEHQLTAVQTGEHL
ncbi:MAG TPA: amidase [Solirubrobacteraceae bacterium]|nr:amidase [Solirubrobacteraceae bacterium]